MRSTVKITLTVVIAVLFSACSLWTQSTATDREIAGIEEYLIDYSKKIEGYRLTHGSLPANLDAEKFFSMLDKYYQAKPEIISDVKKFPVFVRNDGQSYLLVVCDKDSRLALYRDSGKTTDKVDNAYWREGRQVPCQDALK
jgi:hypothetical protein